MAKPRFDDESLNRPTEKETVAKAGKIVPNFKPPAAYKPEVNWDGLNAEITSEVLDGPIPDWNDILEKWGFDPTLYEAVEPIKVSQWDVIHEGEQKTFYSYKGVVRQRSDVKDFDYKDLVREIKKHRRLNENLPGGDKAFVVCLADWQIAKADGDGTEGTVKRILKMIDDVEVRIKELRKIGRDLGTLLVVGLGDIIEGCDGNYSSQVFNVELNRREQTRIARRLIRDAICRWSKLFKKVIVTAVPGNHGENRKDGRNFTNPGDNDDVTVFEGVCEILSANPDAYGHIEFFIPENDTSIALDVGGNRIAFAHGHIPSGGGTPQQKIRNWWKDQSFCNTAIGSAKILVTGHYHHLSVIEYDRDKIHIQCPAMDGGSEWWEDKTGEHSRSGTLTFILDSDGYRDLEII
jgi:hypothetical protein